MAESNRKIAAGRMTEGRADRLPCVASNEHDWQWHSNPQSTPRAYRMCPNCHAVDASEALEAVQRPPLEPDEKLTAQVLAWRKSNDGGNLGVWWPAGSTPGGGSQPIMSVMWDHGGTGELGVFYREEDAADMQTICDIFNWAIEQLAPSETGYYGTRTYRADEEKP